jgi:diacylglycerol kinase (ATP)
MAVETIHLFLNPTAGRGRARRRRDRILQLLLGADLEIEVHQSESVGNLETQVLQQVDAGATRIVVAGGDGSVHEAVNGVLRSSGQAAIGVIPTGTGNDFAKACGIPLNWEHASQLLADRIAANAVPRKLDVGKLNDRFFANAAGIGFDAKVTRIANSIKLPMGDAVYLLAIFRAMIDGVASPKIQIRADDFTWDAPITLAAINNGPWVGGIFHIAPMANNADGLLDLIIAKPVTRRRIMSLLPKLMNGQHMQEVEVVHQSLGALAITAAAPIASHLDGESQALQTEFHISVLEGALNLL